MWARYEVKVDTSNDVLVQVIEEEMKQRREQVAKTCSRYGSRLKIPLKLYNKKLRWFIKVEILMFYQHSDWPFRFDLKHGIMYCENYKVRFQVSMSLSWMFDSDRVEYLGHPPPQNEQCPDLQEDPHPYGVKTTLSSTAGKKKRGVPEKSRELYRGSRSFWETALVFQGRVRNTYCHIFCDDKMWWPGQT